MTEKRWSPEFDAMVEDIGPVEAVRNAIEDYEFLLEEGPPGFGEGWEANRMGMIEGLREALYRLAAGGTDTTEGSSG